MLQAGHHHSDRAWIKCKVSRKSVRKELTAFSRLAIRFQRCSRKGQTHPANLSKMQWLLDCGLKPGNLPYEPQMQTLCLPSLKTEKQQVSVSDTNIVWVTKMRKGWEFNHELTVLMSSILLLVVKAHRGRHEWTLVILVLSLLWHAEPITQTDTRPFCSTLTHDSHDHRIAHGFHLTCRLVSSDFEWAAGMHVFVRCERSQLALFLMPGAPVQSRSRAVRKVEPTGFYTDCIVACYDSALKSICCICSQLQASHFRTSNRHQLACSRSSTPWGF